MHLKISSAEWRPFCPGGDELTQWRKAHDMKINLIRMGVELRCPMSARCGTGRTNVGTEAIPQFPLLSEIPGAKNGQRLTFNPYSIGPVQKHLNLLIRWNSFWANLLSMMWYSCKNCTACSVHYPWWFQISPLKNRDWRRSSWTFNWKSLYKKFRRPRDATCELRH